MGRAWFACDDTIAQWVAAKLSSLMINGLLVAVYTHKLARLLVICVPCSVAPSLHQRRQTGLAGNQEG